MSLTPWVEARRERLGDHTFKIAAVSVPFEKFDHEGEPNDSTGTALSTLVERREIDYAIVGTTPMKETEARGDASRWLVDRDADILIQWDSDEVITKQGILNMLSFVESNPWIQWFRISYTNFVFDTLHYLREPFTPPRIHRVNGPEDYLVVGFWDDNNITYHSFTAGGEAKDIQFSSLTIPKEVVSPLHHSWLSNERSRKKIAYQTARGWSCSYRWDPVKGLCFNEAHFARLGQPIPEVISLI